MFFGRLIKSAVSRQREFLADASAVQYTRNPAGIGSALRKIRDLGSASILKNPKAEEFSHMFFGQVLNFSKFYYLIQYQFLQKFHLIYSKNHQDLEK